MDVRIVCGNRCALSGCYTALTRFGGERGTRHVASVGRPAGFMPDNHCLLGDDVGLREGDAVTAKVEDIEGWLIGQGADNIVGGFSLKAIEEIREEQAK